MTIVKLLRQNCHFVPNEVACVLWYTNEEKAVYAHYLTNFKQRVQSVSVETQAQMRLSQHWRQNEDISQGRILHLPNTRTDLETVTKIWDRDLGKLTRKTPERR